jgi:hypothetical protein
MRDIDIRRALRVEMETAHRDDPNTLILEEMGLCQGVARVDLAVVNGTVHGYEIKSDRDTLARLPLQTETYNKVFDFVTIVTAKCHEKKVRILVPKWWGISVAVQHSDNLKLQVRRRPRRNKAVDPLAMAQLLWREEAIAALTKLGLIEGFRGKKREILWLRLAQNVSSSELSRTVREAVKNRPRAPQASELLS